MIRCRPVCVRFLAAVVLMSADAQAEPRVPASDAEVLERVANPGPRRRQPLSEERLALRARPGDAVAAATLAREYIELARETGDPRYTGRAQAALGAWWHDPEPPAPVLLLRAVLKQSRHEFAPALADLTRLLERDPSDPQAWLTRASVEQVVGDYTAARASCAKLFALAPGLIATACAAGIDSLTGALGRSRQVLESAMAAGGAPSPPVEVWVRTALGEMAARAGDSAAAEREFRRALSIVPDPYALGAFADYLLDRGRAPEAAALLRTHTSIDGLLLRLAEAERATGFDAAPSIADLRDRFAASRLRGDAIHAREEARFALALDHDPARALALAQENWAVQKEPADARLLLEAALASNRKAAGPVLDFLQRAGTEDIHLDELRARLREGLR
jgi:Tfp pilus assembly protein PilF